MCQGVFLLWDPYDGLSLIANIYQVLGPKAFSKKGLSDFELITLKWQGIKKSMKPPFSSMCEWDGSVWTFPGKKHFDCSTRRKRHFGCTSRHARAIHLLFLQALDPVWYRADPPWVGSTYDAGTCFIHWDVVLAKISFLVISEWRQSRVL